jgi:ABC-type proline/glycine betaine transport system permease subunit
MGRSDGRLLIGALCGISLTLAAALVLGQPRGSLAVWSAELAHRWPRLCTLSAVSWLPTIAVPGLSVVSTAAVAIYTKCVDAKLKRQDQQQEIKLKGQEQQHEIALKRLDQQHEIDQDFNKISGQDKRNALQSLINATWFVKRQARLSQARPGDRQYPRAIAIRALDRYVDMLGGENVLVKLFAYAAPPVQQAVDAMLSQRDTLREIHDVALAKLGEIGREWDQIGQGVWQARPDVARTPEERLAQLHVSRHEALDEIEERADDFDVDQLVGQCEEVITAARDDFQRGRHGTPESS